MDVDELDLGILRALQADARLSYRALASQLGTTTPTVSARIKRLENLRIIQGYRVDLDPQAFGGTVHVLRLQVRPAGLRRVTEALAEFPGIEEILAMSGGALLLKARIRPPAVTVDGLHEAIAAHEDILSYDSWEVWSIRQRSPDIAVSGIHVKCHQCQGPIGDPVTAKVAGREQVFCCMLCKKTFQQRVKSMSTT